MQIFRCFFIGGMAVSAFLPSSNAGDPPRLRALIIAVGNYGQLTGWDTIHSENDLPLVREAARQLGIPEEGISILKNEEATFQRITDELRALKESARPGDFIYIHFSGHGQQKQDLDGDEADGFDEALVPYDSPMRFSNAYRGERLLTDDQLRDWIQAIRPILGPEGGLFITLDACHSGTATRGTGFRRGTPFRMAVEGYWRDRSPMAPMLAERGWEASPEMTAAWAPCVVFSASQGNQLNWEYTPPGSDLTCGPLSYALHMGLRNAGSLGSFRELFEQVSKQMRAIAPYQQPEAEGDLDAPFVFHE